MRVIERLMNSAVAQKRNWSLSNTSVRIGDAGTAHVYLHGNHIASVMTGGHLVVIADTFKRYPTPTTRSRLSALGANVRISKRHPYLNGQPL